MDIIREIDNYQPSDKPIYLALGNFDGVHIGHKELLRQVVEEAQKNNGLAAAFIFDPHPVKVINKEKDLKFITKSSQQADLLADLGIDLLIYNVFNEEISRWSPQEFVEKIIISKLNAKHVFVGFNYSFGHKGQGSPELLKEIGEKAGFKVSVIAPVSLADKLVSSTLIREMIEKGQVEDAKQLLGYYPKVEGVVMHGDKRGGDKMGFPTANLKLEDDIIIPAVGVYAAKAWHNGICYNCVVNVGRKPTFHSDHPITVEAHIMNFANNIYGETLSLDFLDKIRDEMKFDSLESLVKQISQDKDLAYKIASTSMI